MIYDNKGQRKYLTATEHQAFIVAANRMHPEAQTFCLALAYTGARISEILALTFECVDVESGVVIVESLKKRRRGIYRAIPVPKQFLQQLETTHSIAAAQTHTARRSGRIWTWGRTTAWSLVKRSMENSGISAGRATPRALRHTFGVRATQENIPLNVIQRWMGHARITTTAIYTNAVGEEERAFASRLWEGTPEPWKSRTHTDNIARS